MRLAPVRRWLAKYRVEIIVACVAALVDGSALYTYFDAYLETAFLGKLVIPLPSLTPRVQQIEAIDAGTALLAGAAVIATVFAIVFALSQFLLSDVAEKYSPRIVDIVSSSRQTRLPTLTFSSLTVFFLSFPLVSPLMKGLIGLVLVIVSPNLFAFAIIVLLRYLQYVQTVISPSKFSDWLERRMLNDISSKVLAKNDFAALSDAAVKALVRGGEQEGTAIFLETAYRVFAKCFEPSTKLETQHILDVLDMYSDSVRRVYQEAAAKGETSITTLISVELNKAAGLVYRKTFGS